MSVGSHEKGNLKCTMKKTHYPNENVPSCFSLWQRIGYRLKLSWGLIIAHYCKAPAALLYTCQVWKEFLSKNTIRHTSLFPFRHTRPQECISRRYFVSSFLFIFSPPLTLPNLKAGSTTKTTQWLSEVFESPKALGIQIVSNQLWKIATLPVPRLALTNSGRTIVAMVVHYSYLIRCLDLF